MSPSAPRPDEGRSRAELLALDPRDALAAGLLGDDPGGLTPALAGEGALAMVEQLRAEQTPLEALDLVLVAFDRAREALPPGGFVDGAPAAHLRATIRLQAGDAPALLRWSEALARACVTTEDLAAAERFLVKVREVLRLSGA